MFVLRDVRKRRFGPGNRNEFELVVGHLDIPQGARIGISGPSGSGKSTLVELLVFAIRPSQVGEFRFLPPGAPSHDIGRTWKDKATEVLAKLRMQHFGIVLQTGGLLRFATVRQNILLSRQMLGLPEDGTEVALACRLDVAHLLDALPETLSVGERQRVAIGRALAHKPTVVIADEPTAALDRINAERVMELLLEVVAERRSTLILTSHDRSLLDRYDFRSLENEIEWNDSGNKVVSRFRMQG